MEDAGHTPFFADDGEVALRTYKENDIAVVITDLRMPKVDGLRLIQNLLAHDPNAAIIVVTGLADHLEKAEEFGAVAGFVKPVVPQDLIETVQEVLGELPPSPAPPTRPMGDDPWGRRAVA